MATERIEVLKSILLDLQRELLQNLFREPSMSISLVSAIEISLMEHELMNSNTEDLRRCHVPLQCPYMPTF